MKYYFSFGLFLLFSIKSYSQNYHPLVNEGSTWNIEYKGFTVGSGTIIWLYDGYRYWLNGDTIINGEQYKKLFSQYKYHYTDNWPYNSWQNFNDIPHLVAGLREDSASKKVWCYNINNFLIGAFNGDTLLYDFNVSIGDTVNWTAEQYVITGKDSVQLLNGEWRQRVILEGGLMSPHYWIEGLGSTESLSQPYFIYFEGSAQLTCFSDSSQLIYHEPSLYLSSGLFVNCDSLISEVENITSDISVSVQPNPIVEHSNFIYHSANGNQALLVLTDLTGRYILEKNVSPEKNYSIDCSDLLSGIYIANLISDSRKIWREKIVVQKK